MATINGTTGNETLLDRIGDDTLIGFAGNDGFRMIDGGTDIVDGGAGNDWVSYEGYSRGVVIDQLNRKVTAGTIVDTLIGIEGVFGSHFNDTITIYGGYAFGRAGNDIFRFTTAGGYAVVGSGNDQVIGTSAREAVSFSADENVVGVDGGGVITRGAVVNLTTGTATDGWGGLDTLTNIDDVEGTHLADTINGSARSNFILGGAGNDSIHGGGTTAITDFDELRGGAGADTLTIKGAGVALGGTGNDTLRFATSGKADLDYMEAAYWSAQQGIVANLTAAVRGGVAAGNATAGFAVKDGEGGTDRLFGVHRISDSAHGDTFFIDTTYKNSYSEAEISLTGGNDYVKVIGAARVLVSYSTAEGAVLADLRAGYATDRSEASLFIGYDRLIGVTNLRGGKFGDLLTGSDGANQIRGRQGNDTIYGLAGNDKLYGDNRQNDTMTGNDILDGGAGNDELGGGRGNDTLTGGVSADLLIGGLGRDVFRFNVALTTANADHILDFSVVDDTIQLDNAVMAALGGTGALAGAKFHKSTAGVAADAADRIIYDTDGGQLWYDANGSAAGGRALIALLTTKPPLTAADFVVI